MTSYRFVIFNVDGDKIFDKSVGEIDDECLGHLDNVLISFDAYPKSEPKLITDLEMGDFSIAVSSCMSCYFASIVSTGENTEIKTINRIISLFLGFAYSQYIEEFISADPVDFLTCNDTLFADFDEEINSFYDPEVTNYICFISDENIIYSKGEIPYKGDEYLETTVQLTDLSPLCRFEPFAAYKGKTNVIVFPYFKHLQIGYVNKVELDEEQKLVDDFKSRLLTTKFTISRLFYKDEEEE